MLFYCPIKHKLARALALVCALACLAACFAALAEEVPESTEAPQVEYLDDQKESLRAAQRRLIDLGLLNGGADGAYGPKTEAALRAFQEQNGLEASGHLDATTLDRLTHIDPSTATYLYEIVCAPAE